MQIETVPSLLLIEGRSVFKFEDEFTLDAVKQWIDTEAYKAEGVAPLSPNVEAFVREGERIK